MRISVIIPSHNRSGLLLRALRSVFAQSQSAFEVIVVDDGSTDGSAGIVTAQFPRVRYIQQPHLGVSRARNVGIHRATGEWLAFLDSDDEWSPDKLERQLTALEAQPDHLVCHTNEIWIRNGNRVNPMKKHEKAGGWIFPRCLPRCVISPSSAVIHRSVFESVGVFDESLPACEDYDLWLRICARYSVLYLSDSLMTKHGGHDDQLSRRYWGMDRFRIRALQKLIAEDCLALGDLVAALETLLHKIDIVLIGARKRGNQVLVAEYKAIRPRYRERLRALQAVATSPEKVTT